MRKSEIFEEFIKIAQERRLVPKVDLPDADNSTRETLTERIMDRDALEKERIKEIAKLYDVKTEMIDEMDYDYNIVEVAHPEAVVVSDSYDKLNGLVENINERSSIMQTIVRKMPTGQVNNPKYAAEKNLMLSLVRVANELDNADKDELRILADACINQTSKQINKTALAPVIVGGIWLAGALLTGLYAKQHLPFYSDGFEQDHQKLVKELDDILNSNSNWGVGKDYNKDFINTVSLIKKDIMDFHGIMKNVLPIINGIDNPKGGKELLQMAQKPEAAEIEKATKALESAAGSLFQRLVIVRDNFKNTDYKNRQIKEKGVVDSVMEKAMLLGGKGLVGDDMDDVSHALDTYMSDVNNIIKVLKDASEIGTKAVNELEQAKVEQQQNIQNNPAPTPQPQQPARSVQEIDDFGTEELANQFNF